MVRRSEAVNVEERSGMFHCERMTPTSKIKVK
jgi:hypothetical protein